MNNLKKKYLQERKARRRYRSVRRTDPAESGGRSGEKRCEDPRNITCCHRSGRGP